MDIQIHNTSENSVGPKESAEDRAREFDNFARREGEIWTQREVKTIAEDYRQFAVVVEKSLQLAADTEAWAVFITLDFWKTVEGGRPKAKHRKNAGRYLFRRFFGPSIEQSKQASERWRAAKRLLGEGLTVDGLVEELQGRGGYKGVNRREKAPRNSQPRAKKIPGGWAISGVRLQFVSDPRGLLDQGAAQFRLDVTASHNDGRTVWIVQSVDSA